MNVEEIYTKMSMCHIKRCYHAIKLADEMLKLHFRREPYETAEYPEDLEDAFCDIMKKYITNSAEEE